MTRLQVAKRVYESNLALPIVYGLPFGLLTYFVSEQRAAASLPVHLVGGLFFGLIVNMTQRKRLLQNITVMQTVKASQNKKFNTYLKQAQLPASEAEKQQLKAYLDTLESNQRLVHKISYPKKYSRLYTYGFLLLFFVATLSIKNLRLLALIYPAVALLGGYGEYKNVLQARRIAALRNKLAAQAPRAKLSTRT